MIAPQRPYDTIEFRRLQLVLVLTVLACVVPAGAQKTTSSTDLPSMLHRTRASGGFGAVDAGVSEAVDVGVQSFTGVMGLDAGSGYSGGMAGSGQTGKAPASRDKLLAKRSAASMMSREIQRTTIRGLSEPAQREIAHRIRPRATMQGFGAASAVSLPMQSGLPSDIQQEPQLEDSMRTESDISTDDIGAPRMGFERFGERFETSQGTSFETLCGQGCGLSADFGTVGRKHAGMNLEQPLPDVLSSSTNAVSAGRLFGRITASETRLREGPRHGSGHHGDRQIPHRFK